MRLVIAAVAAAIPALGLAQYEGAPPHAVEGQPAYEVNIPAKSAPKVYFLNLLDGETVTSPVLVEMGMDGMVPVPAGEISESAMSGHHHLLVNRDASTVTAGEPMEMGEDLIHFGDGSTWAQIELPAGTHTLQLVAGDMNHVPLDPMVASDVITVTVAE